MACICTNGKVPCGNHGEWKAHDVEVRCSIGTPEQPCQHIETGAHTYTRRCGGAETCGICGGKG